MSTNADATHRLGRFMGSQAFVGLVLALDGDLAAGKTVLSQGFAAGLGLLQGVTSPTYPLIQTYDTRPALCHMDWYRLDGADEIEAIGVEDYFAPPWVCLVEWASRGPEVLPLPRIDVRLEQRGPEERLISLELVGIAESTGLQGGGSGRGGLHGGPFGAGHEALEQYWKALEAYHRDHSRL